MSNKSISSIAASKRDVVLADLLSSFMGGLPGIIAKILSGLKGTNPSIMC